jgi:hypothetical protein
MTSETASFQLCDLHDPMLRSMVFDAENIRDACNVRFQFPQSQQH